MQDYTKTRYAKMSGKDASYEKSCATDNDYSQSYPKKLKPNKHFSLPKIFFEKHVFQNN